MHNTTTSASLDYCHKLTNPYLHQFSSISGGNCIIDAGIETRGGIQGDPHLDAVKSCSLNPFEEMSHFGAGIDAQITMFHKTFKDGMLILVKFHVLLKVPIVCLPSTVGSFQLMFSMGGHVINIVDTQVVTF